MNCKPGDLAVIVRSMAGNEGRIVQCIRLAGPGEFPREGIFGGPRWVMNQQIRGTLFPVWTVADAAVTGRAGDKGGARGADDCAQCGGDAVTLSERIRDAALGPAPDGAPWALTNWLGCGEAFDAAHKWADERGGWYRDGQRMEHRRMFLLFVAEAVK